MIEGKPRPQLLPVPLQLVAYLPIAETVDTTMLNKRLCGAMDVVTDSSKEAIELDELPDNLHDLNDFWAAVSDCEPGADQKKIKKFSNFFPTRAQSTDDLRLRRTTVVNNPALFQGVRLWSASNHFLFCGKPIAKSLISVFYKLTFYVTPRYALHNTDVEIIAREGEIFAAIELEHHKQLNPFSLCRKLPINASRTAYAQLQLCRAAAQHQLIIPARSAIPARRRSVAAR